MTDKVSKDQYGRKTWDVDAYAEGAKKGQNRSSQPSDKALNSVRSLKDQTYLQHKATLLNDSVLAVSKHTLISSDANTSSTFGKNKRFGFFCPVCDLSFRDTLALVDHVNSPQHAKNAQSLARKSGISEEEDLGGLKKASYEEVALTIEELVKQLLRTKASSANLDSIQDRVLKRQAMEAKKLAMRQQRRKRRKAKQDSPVDANDEIARAMGFHGFGTTKIA